MPNKTKRGPSNVAYFKAYEAQNKKEKNKQKKLDKHLKLHPNDKQSVDNLGVPVAFPKQNKLTNKKK